MKLKRKLIGLLLSMIIVFFSGCQKFTDYTFDYEDLNEAVVGIEIIYKRNWGDDREELLYVFQEEEISPFLEEFCELTFETTSAPRPSCYYIVKLLYQDGSCDQISTGGGGKWDAEGKFVTYAPFCARSGREAYYNLLLKYIELDPELDGGYALIVESQK